MKNVKACCSFLSLVFLAGVFSFEAHAVAEGPSAGSRYVVQSVSGGGRALERAQALQNLRILLSGVEDFLKDGDKTIEEKEGFLVMVSKSLDNRYIRSFRMIRNTFFRLNDDSEIAPQIKVLFKNYSLVL